MTNRWRNIAISLIDPCWSRCLRYRRAPRFRGFRNLGLVADAANARTVNHSKSPGLEPRETRATRRIYSRPDRRRGCHTSKTRQRGTHRQTDGRRQRCLHLGLHVPTPASSAGCCLRKASDCLVRSRRPTILAWSASLSAALPKTAGPTPTPPIGC
jgi:hypothetical protein